MAVSMIDQTIFNALKESVGDDFIGELVHTFLEEAPLMLDEIQTAVAAGEAESFRRAAHSLKSNANTFGATTLAELAKELEYMARENNLNIEDKLLVLRNRYEEAAKELEELTKSLD